VGWVEELQFGHHLRGGTISEVPDPYERGSADEFGDIIRDSHECIVPPKSILRKIGGNAP
jgi:hypothetical protein